MTAQADVQLLADHSVWLALPAFAPAIVVAGVVIYIAAKNRREKDTTPDGPDSNDSATPGHN
jgi:heme/copper-type cytochrome/quinol oxidase subunit 2